MKILITLIRWKGGVGRVVENQKRELEKLGHEVEVISREDDLKCFSTKKAWFKLQDEVLKREYDVLYSQDWSCALPLILRRNHFVCFHGKEINTNWLQKLIGKLKGKKVFVVGDKLKKKFPKATILYNAVDTAQFFDLGKERKYLGWVDKATEEIDLQDIIKLAREHGLKYSIAKDIKPDKMNDWYNSLKVFVSKPDKSAGFNLVWSEALSAGVPEVIGNNNGIGIDKIKKTWKELSWKENARILEELFNKFLPYEKLKKEVKERR